MTCDRRHFLQILGTSALAAASPRLSLANAPTENRLVLVVLRGGLDGLHAVVPYKDPNYRRLRPNLALSPPGTSKDQTETPAVLDLDGHFGLHPALASLHPFFARRELLIVPAATTRYRKRSHFDGQNVLENGSDVPFGAKDGWLNRSIASLATSGPHHDRRLGLALGPAVPLMLQGPSPVATWADSPLPPSDEDFLRRLAHTYQDDPVFSRALSDARASPLAQMAPTMDGKASRAKALEASMGVAAKLLSAERGPRVAVVESHGWDTHFAQERRLTKLFGQLSAGLDLLHKGLAGHWRQTAVVVVSEFGRTAAENGSRGTDHGVGGLALLLGGAIQGGKIVGDWPGLATAELHQNRDLQPTVHYEGLFKAALIEHLGVSATTVEMRVFPNSGSIRPIEGLFRNV